MVPVTVTVPPTGMSPVHVMADALSTSVPEDATWSPLGLASSTVPPVGPTIEMPSYEVAPVLVNVAVSRTTDPDVAVADS
jgi:hypothetical protein